MGMVKEFRTFAVRGNVVDMAIGVITGAAFGKIVSSLVADVIMPPIGVILGGVNFSSLAVTVREAVGDTPAIVIHYGQFIQTVVDFTIIALAMFIVVKAMNAVMDREEEKPPSPPAPPEPSKEELLLTEIRDLLRERG